MELLFKKSCTNIFKFKGITRNRYGNYQAMDSDVAQTRDGTYRQSYQRKFISEELLTRYCKTIGHKYPDHKCSKCNGGDNHIPEVQLEQKKNQPSR